MAGGEEKTSGRVEEQTPFKLNPVDAGPVDSTWVEWIDPLM